ncbi:MAG: ribbon-helix-helix protein, CopG family [Erythrobacter sp.]|nr:ribbon-helix-helix protein, CopG family [Erythrobacter sp.]NCQ64256.1 ribbon-helix-helix protein, CopG family [Alphaproteobacteria bacterium]
MSKLERITVTMPAEMAARLRAAVERGEYATTSEVVREALRDWGEYQERRAEAVERLRQMVEAADAGPSYPAEEVFAEIRQLVAERVATYRAEDNAV